MDSSVANLITQIAPSYGIAPALAIAQANQESGGNQSAVGAAGEIGVFQLLPSTAASLGVDPTDVTENIEGGCEYLASLIGEFGGIAQGLAAYNCGPGNMQKAVAQGGANWFSFIPASTQAYVTKIMAAAGNALTATVATGSSAISTAAASVSSEVTSLLPASVESFTESPYFIPALAGVGFVVLVLLL